MSNDCRIKVLPPLLVNKIAAGEVVERPASVVKELTDNAIDSGAERIAVSIEDGGKQLIRVTDDGCGMSSEELRLSVAAHATSKITTEDDLYTIASMGFRGEALASISSVSKLRIASRRRDAAEGHEVRVAGEQFESSKAAGCPVGTTVEVRDLFFNVPARRKFLKGRSTEVGHINEQFARAALAWPELCLELNNNGRTTQNLPPSSGRLDRIAKLYGPDLAESLLTVNRDERGVRMEAYIAPPARSRASANWQYTFVNGRYIRDRYVQHAIRESFRGLMEPNRHGVVYLFLTLDPESVDVNVHPTKIEVRWADSGLIHSQVLSALRETLRGADLTPALRTDRATPTVSPQDQQRMRHELASMLKTATPMQPDGRPRSDAGFPSGLTGATGPSDRAASPWATGDKTDSWRALYGPPTNDTATNEGHAPQQPLPTEGLTTPPRAMQMHNLYLVAETPDGIMIVDQHALHERVLYEQFRAELTRGPLESQRLLLPETVTVTPKEADALTANDELLQKLGIEVVSFGHDSIAVQSFPALLKDADVVAFMRDLLDYLADQPAASTEVVIHKVLDMMACKAAVKSGDALSPGEVDELMKKRHLVDKSSNCPHGRPTMLQLTKADLNRQFKRT